MISLINKLLHFADRILTAICRILPTPLRQLIEHYHRMLTYAFMGCLNTMIDYALFFLLYRGFGVPISISQMVGLICGSSNGYLLNSNITFREGKGRSKGQYFQYVGVDIVLAILSGIFMSWAEPRSRIPVFLIKVFISAVALVIHYVVYKYFVFRIKREDDEK